MNADGHRLSGYLKYKTKNIICVHIKTSACPVAPHGSTGTEAPHGTGASYLT
jgi:hypothetical protein